MAARNTKPTSKKKRQANFIIELSQTGNVTLAAQACDIQRTLLYDWRNADAEFARAWDDALDHATDLLEGEARRRAMDGVDEPRFHEGEVCGYVRKYSDTLLIFLLKALRPEKYRERTDTRVSGADGGPIQTNDVSGMSDIEKATRLAWILKKGMEAGEQ